MVRKLVKPGLIRTFVGLDPGTTFGYCVLEVTDDWVRIASCGHWVLARSFFEGGGMQMRRLSDQLYGLLERFKRGDPFVAFEEIRFHRGVDAAHIYGAFVAKVMEVCEVRDVPYTGVNVSTVKQVATGKGNAKKELVREVMSKLFDVEFEVHDESDACAVAFACAVDMGLVKFAPAG